MDLGCLRVFDEMILKRSSFLKSSGVFIQTTTPNGISSNTNSLTRVLPWKEELLGQDLKEDLQKVDSVLFLSNQFRGIITTGTGKPGLSAELPTNIKKGISSAIQVHV